MNRKAGRVGKGASKDVGEVLRVLQSPLSPAMLSIGCNPTCRTQGGEAAPLRAEADSTPPLLLRSTQSRITYGQYGTNKVFVESLLWMVDSRPVCAFSSFPVKPLAPGTE